MSEAGSDEVGGDEGIYCGLLRTLQIQNRAHDLLGNRRGRLIRDLEVWGCGACGARAILDWENYQYRGRQVNGSES